MSPMTCIECLLRRDWWTLVQAPPPPRLQQRHRLHPIYLSVANTRRDQQRHSLTFWNTLWHFVCCASTFFWAHICWFKNLIIHVFFSSYFISFLLHSATTLKAITVCVRRRRRPLLGVLGTASRCRPSSRVKLAGDVTPTYLARDTLVVWCRTHRRRCRVCNSSDDGGDGSSSTDCLPATTNYKMLSEHCVWMCTQKMQIARLAPH